MIRGAARGAVRAFGELAPGAAARWLGRQLQTPRRVPRLRLDPPAALGRERRIRFGEVPLALTEWDEGPTVLLVHGWGSDARSFWGLVDPLAARGLRVVALDLPAHGRSGGRRTNMLHCAEAILHVAAELGPLRGAVGHSFGGPTVALAGVRGATPERLVMAAPPLSVERSLRGIAREVGFPDPVFERMARAFAERFRFDWAELDTARLVTRLGVPLLVVHDEEDRVTPWTHGAAVARAAGRATLLTTAGLGHRAILADRAVAARAAEFLGAPVARDLEASGKLQPRPGEGTAW